MSTPRLYRSNAGCIASLRRLASILTPRRLHTAARLQPLSVDAIEALRFMQELRRQNERTAINMLTVSDQCFTPVPRWCWRSFVALHEILNLATTPATANLRY